MLSITIIFVFEFYLCRPNTIVLTPFSTVVQNVQEGKAKFSWGIYQLTNGLLDLKLEESEEEGTMKKKE